MKTATKTNGKSGSKNTTKTETKAPRATVEDSTTGPLVIKAAAKEPKELRGESKRGKFLDMLKRPGGVTMNQATSQFGWKPRDVADALRLLSKVNGVSTKRDEKGHWHAAGR